MADYEYTYEYTPYYFKEFNAVFMPYLAIDQLANIKSKINNNFPDDDILNDIKLLLRKAYEYYYRREDKEFPYIHDYSMSKYIKSRCEEISFKSKIATDLFKNFSISEKSNLNDIRINLADDIFFKDLCNLLELKSKTEMDDIYARLLQFSLDSDNKFISPRIYFERYLIPQTEQDKNADHLSRKKFLIMLTRTICRCAEHNSGIWLTNGKTGFFLYNFVKSFEKGIDNYADEEILQIYSDSLVTAEIDKDFILYQLSKTIQNIQSKFDDSAKKNAESIFGKITGCINSCDVEVSPIEFGLECFSGIELIVDKNCESDDEADDIADNIKDVPFYHINDKNELENVSDGNKFSKQHLEANLCFKKCIDKIKNSHKVQEEFKDFRQSKGITKEGVTCDKNPYLYIIYLIAADRTEQIFDQTNRGGSLRTALREFLYDCCFAFKHKRDMEALEYYKEQINIIIKDKFASEELISQLSIHTSEGFDKKERDAYIAKIDSYAELCESTPLKRSYSSLVKRLNKYEETTKVDRLTDQIIKLAFEQPAVNYRSIEELVYYRVLELNGCMKEAKQAIYDSIRKGHSSKAEKEAVCGEYLTLHYENMYSNLMSAVKYGDDISKMIESLKKQGYESARPFWTDIRKTANAIFNYLINYDIVHLLISTSNNSSVNRKIDTYLSEITNDTKNYQALLKTAGDNGYVDVQSILNIQQHAVSYNILEDKAIKQNFSDLLYAILHPKFIDFIISDLGGYNDMKPANLSFKPPLVSRSALIKAFTVYVIISGNLAVNEYINTLNAILSLSGFAGLNEKSAFDCYMIAITYFQLNVGYAAEIEKANISIKSLLDKIIPSSKDLPKDPKTMFDEGGLYLSEISYKKDTVKIISADKSDIWNNSIRKISLRDAYHVYIPYYGAVIEAKSERKYILVFVYPISAEYDNAIHNFTQEYNYKVIVFDCQTEKQSTSTVEATIVNSKEKTKQLYIKQEDFLKAVVPIDPFKEELKQSSYPLLTFHSCYISNNRKEDYVLCIFAISHSNDGTRQIVGGWTFAKNSIDVDDWINILTSVKEKCIESLHYVCSDIATGFDDALKIVYPNLSDLVVQSHMIQLISNRTLKVFSTGNSRQVLDPSNEVRNITVFLYKQSAAELTSDKVREKLNKLPKLIAENERYKAKTADSQNLIKEMADILDTELDQNKRRDDFKEALKRLVDLLENDVSGYVRSITVLLKSQSVKELLNGETRNKINELREIIFGSEQYKLKIEESEILFRKMAEILDSMESDLNKSRNDFEEALNVLLNLLDDNVSSEVKKKNMAIIAEQTIPNNTYRY